MKTIGNIKFDDEKIKFSQTTSDILKRFFSYENVKKLVNKNDYKSLFNIWLDDMRYPISALVAFLLMCDIDFIKYLDFLYPSMFDDRWLVKIIIPKNIEKINFKAFYNGTDAEIYYDGTLNDFAWVEKVNTYALSDREVICSDGVYKL